MNNLTKANSFNWFFLINCIALSLFPSPTFSQADKPNLFDYSNPVNSNSSTSSEPSFGIRSVRGNGLYRLGPGDQISITILNVPEFSGTQTILNDGTIRLSLIGSIPLQGMTLDQAEADLSKRYLGILKEPIVSINLVQSVRPLTITVIGAVNQPGAFSFRPSAGELPSVVSAIKSAQGISPQADIRNIEVRRLQTQGESQIVKVDLWNLLQNGGDQGSNLILLDGDTIFVATASNPDPKESIQIAQANFATNMINISVVGEVATPGQLSVRSGTPLNQAILKAGGLTKRANPNLVELLRVNPNGSVSKRQYSLNFSEELSEEKNPPLKDSDVIFIERSGAAAAGDTLEVLTSPLAPFASILSIIRGFSSVGSD